MGFDIYWSLHRDTWLDATERRQAAAHVARWRNVIAGYDLALPGEPGASVDGVIACYSLRPSHGDPRRRDHGGYLDTVIGEVLEALAELRRLFDGIDMRAADDFFSYRWTGDAWTQVRKAPSPVTPEPRDGWVHASDLAPAPQPVPAHARPLLAPVGDEAAIRASLEGVAATDAATRAGWMDALTTRLALDAWEPRSWTFGVLDALTSVRARSAWRSLAVAADAGLDDATWALGQVADATACFALGDLPHPAWAAFAHLVGYRVIEREAPTGELATIAAACRAVHEVGALVGRESLDDDDDLDDASDDTSSPSVTHEARARIAEAANALRPLGIEIDDDTRPLLAPSASDSRYDIDVALDVVTVALFDKLAPFIAGALPGELRAAWRQQLVASAGEVRERLASTTAEDVAQSLASTNREDVARSLASTTAEDVAKSLASRTAEDGAKSNAPTTTADAPAPPSAAPLAAAILDELLDVYAREAELSADLIARAGLPSSVAAMDRWDRAKAIRERIGELPHDAVAPGLLAALSKHRTSNLGEICGVILPGAIDDAVAARLLDIWHDAFELPWESPSRVTDYLAPVVSHARLFNAILDEVAAPDDGPLRNRTTSAFDLLGCAKARREDAAAALVARARVDRGRPRSITPWRSDLYHAMRKLDAPDAIATAILELAELETAQRAYPLLELLVRHGASVDVVERALDIRELTRDAARALCRSADGDRWRVKLLDHPYWKVRVVAADENPEYSRSKLDMFAVAKAVEDAKLPLSDDERRNLPARDSRSWTELASEHGGLPYMAPLPPARDGLASACAEYRAWAIWAVDEQVDVEDATARVLADELDIAMVALGHMRTGAPWQRWRAKLPELPYDRRGRLAWARAREDAQLPPLLARVRDEGAEVVAAELPRPYVVLAPERRRELEALERPIAERGLALLRDGVR